MCTLPPKNLWQGNESKLWTYDFGGSDDDPEKVQALEKRAKSWIEKASGTVELDFTNKDQLMVLVQQISYKHTLMVLDNTISVVFYDVTTLYFEIDQEDELRKTGFSKEGKHQHPQIVLGLLVSKNGYPLAYEIFEGNKFEGHTMLPVVDAFKAKYNLS